MSGKKTLIGNPLGPAVAHLKEHLDPYLVPNYLLPLLILKTYSALYEWEVEGLEKDFSDLGEEGVAAARYLAEAQPGLTLFYVPPKARWKEIQEGPRLGLGERINQALEEFARFHLEFWGHFRTLDYAPSVHGHRLIPDPVLGLVVEDIDRLFRDLNPIEQPDLLTEIYRHTLEAVGRPTAPDPYTYPWRHLAEIARGIRELQEGREGRDPLTGGVKSGEREGR